MIQLHIRSRTKKSDSDSTQKPPTRQTRVKWKS